MSVHALHSCAVAFGLALFLVAFDDLGIAYANDRPISIGAGLGYAALNNGRYGDDSPYVHGRQVQVYARLNRPQTNLEPRIEFLSQSFDLDASRLTQAAVIPQLIGGDRRLRAALAGLQWSIGRPRRVRAYLVAEGGYSWERERWLESDARRSSGTLGRWMTSGGGGLESHLGSYGAFIEGRYSHRYEGADAFFPSHAWSMSGGFVF